MASLFSKIAAFVFALLLTSNLATAQNSTSPTTDYSPWGFDLRGMDRTTKPGDGFYRYVNGGWYDRTTIPPDRTSNSIDRVLTDIVEARVRDILEYGEQ